MKYYSNGKYFDNEKDCLAYEEEQNNKEKRAEELIRQIEEKQKELKQLYKEYYDKIDNCQLISLGTTISYADLYKELNKIFR